MMREASARTAFVRALLAIGLGNFGLFDVAAAAFGEPMLRMPDNERG